MLKITETSHKAWGGAAGAILAAVIVRWLTSMDINIFTGDPVMQGYLSVVIEYTLYAIIGFITVWFSPANKPKEPK